MKNWSNLFKAGLIFIAVGVIGMLGLGKSQNPGSLIGGGVLVIGIGALLIYLDIQKRKKAMTQSRQAPTQVYSPVYTPVSIPVRETVYRVEDGSLDYFHLPYIDGEWGLKYRYRNELVNLPANIFDMISGHGGESITFAKTPNEDPDAISAFFNGIFIGEVAPGYTRDMIRDWTARNELIHAHINTFSRSDGRVFYRIGFYKRLAYYAHRDYKLTAVTSRVTGADFTREDNLRACDVGNPVTIEEKVVLCYDSEIGCLPAGAASFIEDTDDERLIGVIKSIDLNEPPQCVITLYNMDVAN